MSLFSGCFTVSITKVNYLMVFLFRMIYELPTGCLCHKWLSIFFLLLCLHYPSTMDYSGKDNNMAATIDFILIFFSLIQLFPDCAPHSITYILELLRSHRCAGCQIYRAESRGPSWDPKGDHISYVKYLNFLLKLSYVKYLNYLPEIKVHFFLISCFLYPS